MRFLFVLASLLVRFSFVVSLLLFILMFNVKIVYMSKGNMLLGYARGKVGSLVFLRAGGEQRTRAYVSSVNDANSEAQVMQRTQLSNIIAFYRAVIRLLNHSFTNRKGNQSSYNAFVSKNLNVVKVYSTKEMVDAGGCVVAPYRISDGNLPSIQTSGSGDSTVTNLAVGQLVIGSDTTIAQLTEALVENNANVRAGMQLSYISVIQGVDTVTGYPVAQAGLYEITLDLADTRLVHDFIPDYGLASVNGFIGHGEHHDTGGFAWILSEKDSDGKTVCSSQNLILNDNTTYASFRSTTALTRALSSYNAAPDKFLTPGESSSSGTSTSPTVASVRFGSEGLLNANKSRFTMGAAGTEVQVDITGSNLSAVQSVQLEVGGIIATLTGDTPATDTTITRTYTVPSGLAETSVSRMTIRLDGATVWSWTATTSSGGEDIDDPIG